MSKKKTLKVLTYDVENVEVASISCCGIYEIDGLPDNPWAAIFALFNEAEGYNIILFHDSVNNSKCGDKLANLIRRHRLGSLTASKIVRNQNTGNSIRMWTFYPNWEKIRTIVENAEEKGGWNYYDEEDEDYDAEEHYQFTL